MVQMFQIVIHCVISVQIRSFFWSVFSVIRTGYRDLRSKSPYSVQIRENTDQKKLRIWALFTQCRKIRALWNFKIFQNFHLFRETSNFIKNLIFEWYLRILTSKNLWSKGPSHKTMSLFRYFQRKSYKINLFYN